MTTELKEELDWVNNFEVIPTHKLFLLHLKAEGGHMKASAEAISKKIGVSKRAIQSAVKTLRVKELIRVVPNKDAKGMIVSNEYYLNTPVFAEAA